MGHLIGVLQWRDAILPILRHYITILRIYICGGMEWKIFMEKEIVPAQHRNLGENRKKHTFNWNFTVANKRFYTILIKWWGFYKIHEFHFTSKTRPLYVCALFYILS